MEETINAGRPSATSDPESEEVSEAELADEIADSERALKGEGVEKMRRRKGRLEDRKCWRRWS
jgi:hypothetical protein